MCGKFCFVVGPGKLYVLGTGFVAILEAVCYLFWHEVKFLRVSLSPARLALSFVRGLPEQQ